MNSTANRRKHQRFIKRLTTTFFVDNNRFTGISSDISAGGLFIRTSRGFPMNTPVSIEVLLPDNTVSALKGIVRRTLRTSVAAKKNGMGIEIIETDTAFANFLKSLGERNETNCAGNSVSPEMPAVSCMNYGIEQDTFACSEQERRKHKRVKTEHMALVGEMPSAKAVKVINISISGILIRADKRLDIGRTYVLKIGYKDKASFVKASVAWSCLVESSKDSHGNITPLYIAGMQFTENAHEKLNDILTCIHQDAPLSGRQINIPESGDGNASCCNGHNLPSRDSSKEASDAFSEKASEENLPDPETEYTSKSIGEIEYMHNKYLENDLNYYEVLQISTSAAPEEVKKAYHKRAKDCHPDRHTHLPPDIKKKLTALFAYLNEAYGILINSKDRREYDMSLSLGKHKTVSNRELAHQEFERGKIEFWNGNLSAAEMLFQKSLYLDNSSGKYFHFYAKTLFRTGKFREAAKAISEAIRIDSVNADYFVEAGYIYDAMNLLHRARENFEMALRIVPQNVKALEGIAELKRKNGIHSIRYTISNPIRYLKKSLAG